MYYRVALPYPRDLKIPGRELKGVYYAMQFLKQQNKRNAGRDPFANAAIESNIFPEDLLAGGKERGSDWRG